LNVSKLSDMSSAIYKLSYFIKFIPDWF
ncbi:unnamed protein product, partial [Allacma fusca]